MAIWKYLIAHDNGITNFHFEVAADLLNEEEIALIRTMRPGMIQLEIGVQSTNPDTIREIHRKMDFAQVSEVVTRVQEGHNVHQHLDLIAGLPYEDYDSFGKSFCDVYQLRPQQISESVKGILYVSGGAGVRLCMSEPGALRGAVYQVAAI